MSYVIARPGGYDGAKRYLRWFQCGADGSVVAIAYGARDEARTFAHERSARALVRHLGVRTVLDPRGHAPHPPLQVVEVTGQVLGHGFEYLVLSAQR